MNGMNWGPQWNPWGGQPFPYIIPVPMPPDNKGGNSTGSTPLSLEKEIAKLHRKAARKLEKQIEAARKKKEDKKKPKQFTFWQMFAALWFFAVPIGIAELLLQKYAVVLLSSMFK